MVHLLSRRYFLPYFVFQGVDANYWQFLLLLVILHHVGIFVLRFSIFNRGITAFFFWIWLERKEEKCTFLFEWATYPSGLLKHQCSLFSSLLSLSPPLQRHIGIKRAVHKKTGDIFSPPSSAFRSFQDYFIHGRERRRKKEHSLTFLPSFFSSLLTRIGRCNKSGRFEYKLLEGNT